MWHFLDVIIFSVTLIILGYHLPVITMITIACGLGILALLQHSWMRNRSRFLHRDPCWDEVTPESINKREEITKSRRWRWILICEGVLDFFSPTLIPVYFYAIAIGMIIGNFFVVQLR